MSKSVIEDLKYELFESNTITKKINIDKPETAKSISQQEII